MSIEALNWARKIHVGDSLAKSLLRAIADYADEEGHCFPSHGRLAADCEMSEDTVKRRIRQLEELGLLVTFRCWCDENGRRNQEQRGRETSKEIRLALHKRIIPATVSEPLDVDLGGAASTPSISGEGVLPAPPGGAVVHPPNEPSFKQESPPNPPPGGSDQNSDQGKLVDPEHFEPFFTSCLGWRTMPRDLALSAFSALSIDEQGRARAASPLHAAECTRFKRRSKDAHKLIREKFWERYPDAKLPDRAADPVWIEEGPDIDALRVLARIADRAVPKLIHDDVKGSGLLRASPVTDDLRALAAFAGSDILDWFVAEPETGEFNAWRRRIHDWTGQWAEPRIVMRRGKKLIPMLPGQPPMEVQNRIKGIPVPCRWPPKKDGAIYDDGNVNDQGTSSHA